MPFNVGKDKRVQTCSYFPEFLKVSLHQTRSAREHPGTLFLEGFGKNENNGSLEEAATEEKIPRKRCFSNNRW